MSQDFSLDIMAPVLAKFAPPGGPFDPQGTWRHAYTVYSLANQGPLKADVAGNVTISRTPAPGGGSVLAIDYRKRTPASYSQKVSGSIRCAPSALATPVEWEFTAEMRSEQRNDVLKKRKKDFPPGLTHTCNWSLFDAVQRLPRTPGKALRFTLFDEWELPKPNQSLVFRKTADLAFGRAHAFEQLGDGILPLVYWTDDQGRLLFVISGLMAYAIEGGKS